MKARWYEEAERLMNAHHPAEISAEEAQERNRELTAQMVSKQITKKQAVHERLENLVKAGVTFNNVTKQDVEFLHVYVGEANSKVTGEIQHGQVMPDRVVCAGALDMLSVFTCPKGVPCAKDCYAGKGCCAFLYNKEVRMGNFLLWQGDPVRYEEECKRMLRHYELVRINADGDIPDQAYADMIWRIVEACPDTQFYFMTKQFRFVNDTISRLGNYPANCVVMLSGWDEKWRPENPHGLPMYEATEGEIPEDANICNGNCGACFLHGIGCFAMRSTGLADTCEKVYTPIRK